MAAVHFTTTPCEPNTAYKTQGRSSIFTHLRDQKAVFYFLQETYSEPGDELFWKKEWGGEIFFSHGTCHSKGVCILFDPSIEANNVKFFL